MSVGAETGLALAAGAIWAAALLVPRPSLRMRLAMVALAAALFGLIAFGFVPEVDLFEHPAFLAVMLAAIAVALLLSVAFLVRHWRDEDALAEEFGPEDGYIVRTHRPSARARAVLLLLFLAAGAFAVFMIAVPRL